MEITEYDVVIKKLTVDDLKQIFGEGRRDVRVRFSWSGSSGSPRTSMVNTSMEVVIETWEPKAKTEIKK